jgi:two-component system, NtrC family, sensor histidine kinase KinB
MKMPRSKKPAESMIVLKDIETQMPQDQRAVLELLYRVSREFASALDLKTVLTRVLFAAINNVGGERGSVVVLDDHGRAVESAIAYGNQMRESTTIQLRDTVEHGLAGWVVRSRQAVLVPDTSRDPRWLRREDDAIERSGAKAAICVPLLARERLVGVLTLVHPTPKAYGDEHLSLMQAIADQAGVAILNARLFSESQRQARVMTTLAEGAVNMNTSLHMEEVFERILTQTKQALQVETAVLGMVDKSGEEIIFRAAVGEHSRGLPGKRVKVQEGVAGKVVRDGRGMTLAAMTPEVRLAEAEQFAGENVRALSCAPIHAQGKVIGVLEVFNPLNKVFDPDSILMLTGLGGLAGSTIQNAQLFESLDAAQQRYHDLFEDSIDPIFLSDLTGHIFEANRQAATFSGYSDEALRELSIEQVHEVNFERTGQKFEKISASTVVYESTLYDKNGSTHPVQVYARKVAFNGAESIQWILRDITERKDLDTLREDLAAMIYHDLRSPLANILSSVEMLAEVIPEAEKETSESILRIAHHSIERIQRLISSLLDLNRLEQNQPLGERLIVTIPILISEALEAVKPAAEGRCQVVEMEMEEHVPAVFVDVDMIRRVMINLLENAIKYTPAGGHIKIAVKTDGEFVRLSMEDNGPGIPEADRERVFDKFMRLKNGQGNPGGLGVGLAFCKLAVQGHGGRIWVESAPESGSVFLFTLPMAKEK